MGVQKTYGYATSKGVAGGIYDMFHYPVDSRFNEEATGKLHGSSVALPTSASTADNFEGVVINGFDRQQDLEGKLYVLNNQNVGVMRRGRVWVRLATDAAPAYGDALHMIVEGDEAGCFAKEGGIAIPGRFIGAASNGVAPVELYGVPAASGADGHAASTDDAKPTV